MMADDDASSLQNASCSGLFTTAHPADLLSDLLCCHLSSQVSHTSTWLPSWLSRCNSALVACRQVHAQLRHLRGWAAARAVCDLSKTRSSCEGGAELSSASMSGELSIDNPELS